MLVALITNDYVLSRVSPLWVSGKMFETQWADMIGTWCVRYYRRHNKAPAGNVDDLFTEWAAGRDPEDVNVQMVESFMESLGDLWDPDNPEDEQHLLDYVQSYFNDTRLKIIHDEVSVLLEAGRTADAREVQLSYRPMDIQLPEYYDLEDIEVWQRAFETRRSKPLIYYPGDAGQFFSEAFRRREFYSFLAPDKSGKTTYLVDACYRAIRNKQKVAYFECGDGDEEEFHQRFGFRAALRPEHDGDYDWPVGWNEESGEVEIEHRRLRGLHFIDGFKMVVKKFGGRGLIRVTSHSNSTINVNDIHAILQAWEVEKAWRPDVIVIDYADILADLPGFADKGHESVNATWKALRRLSQDWDALVLTATQTNSGGYAKTEFLLGPQNYSGSKGKNAHVNGMIGVNITSQERGRGEARLNWVVKRKQKLKLPRACVRVAGCFPVDCPVLVSRW